MADITVVTSVDEDSGFTGSHVTAPDGLRLYVRQYGRRNDRSLPVVCLPGLSRHGADFHELGLSLAADTRQPRWIVTIDSRGRGGSDHDPDPDNYTLPVELADVLAVLTALEIGAAVFVGTSRGGILAMLLGGARPAAIAGIVLNDIGPVVDPRGLVRIKSYVGKMPTPRTFEEGAEILRRIGDAQFPNFGPDRWLRQARRTWKIQDGRLVPSYDPNLTRTLESVDLEQPLPPLWAPFDSLARRPLMVIHGARSDTLSAATLEAMRARRLDIDVLEVADQGHAPLLDDAEQISRIAAFMTFCEVTTLGF